MAGTGSPMWSFLLRGTDKRGRRFMLKTFFNGGMGATAERDGLSATSWPSNISGAPVEVIEQAAPVRVLAKRLRRGSGGAGRFRGGDGLELEFELLDAGPAVIGFNAERTRSPAHGLFGGGAGATGEILLNGAPIDIRELLQLAPGDRLLIRTPGGGGYGAEVAALAAE
jgi:N-methylhydantoinase B/oxoprolinase/acetone carboxylase alpha subunit